jgi:S-adenosylmethionine-diacylglycerol 3-amino-3-carboxypropyl transferase
MNLRQNALLELKLAGIRKLDFPKFFQMFGRGRLPDHQTTYWSRLRPELADPARAYWDRNIGFFAGTGWRRSFYFHGTSGLFARLINTYIDKIARVRPLVQRLLNAESIEEQRRIYIDEGMADIFWSRFLRWAAGRDATLSFLGVPRAQRQHLERNYNGNIVKFMQECIETVFTKLPLSDNYFWRVYLTGHYEPNCCPEYLKEENFVALKEGLADRIQTHTASILEFLQRHNGRISRYVLLDHMDWLSSKYYPILEREWQAIVDRAAPGTRIIWRSGGERTDFVDDVKLRIGQQTRRVGEILSYHRQMANELHERDRVHTYGSFHIADLMA